MGGAVCPEVLALFLEEVEQNESELACLLPWELCPRHHGASPLVPPALGAPLRNKDTKRGWIRDEIPRLDPLNDWVPKSVVTSGYH